MAEFDTRVGAYGVIVRGDRILLTHFCGPGVSSWTLPGGGLELGEDAETAAVREILEETGYRVALDGLLGVDSVQIPARDRLDGRDRHLHSFRVIYRARVLGGELKREIGGSTDDARWVRIADVPTLDRVELVDAGLRLWEQPGETAGNAPAARAGASSPT